VRERNYRGDRIDESNRAGCGDGDDGNRSIARVVAPRFWAGVISMPLLAALFPQWACSGAIVGVRDRCRRGLVLVADAGGGRFREDVLNRR